MTGRPGRSGRTLITEEVWQCLLGKVRNGRSLHSAAADLGFVKSAVYNRMRRNPDWRRQWKAAQAESLQRQAEDRG